MGVFCFFLSRNVGWYFCIRRGFCNLFILCNVGGVYCCRHGVSDTDNNTVPVYLDNIIFIIIGCKTHPVVCDVVNHSYLVPHLITVGFLVRRSLVLSVPCIILCKVIRIDDVHYILDVCRTCCISAVFDCGNGTFGVSVVYCSGITGTSANQIVIICHALFQAIISTESGGNLRVGLTVIALVCFATVNLSFPTAAGLNAKKRIGFCHKPGRSPPGF